MISIPISFLLIESNRKSLVDNEEKINFFKF